MNWSASATLWTRSSSRMVVTAGLAWWAPPLCALMLGDTSAAGRVTSDGRRYRDQGALAHRDPGLRLPRGFLRGRTRARPARDRGRRRLVGPRPLLSGGGRLVHRPRGGEARPPADAA